MAGSINLSLSQQFDAQGTPLAGGQLFFYAAGTTTPQSAYVDSGLTIPYPNPITLDAAGRIPSFFLADGSIKIRLTDRFGVVQVSADNLVVVGPSSGGGGGGGSAVDPTTIFNTGMVADFYGTGSVPGFVRMNGRTIGSLLSGATERANVDTQALFIYLWNMDPNLAVSSGRGASAVADYAANKNIALPDHRGRLRGALDDMGNTPAGRITTPYFGSNPTVLGAAGGVETRFITKEFRPNIDYTVDGVPATISVTTTDLAIVSGIVQAAGLAAGGSGYTVLNAGAAASQAARVSTGSYTPQSVLHQLGYGGPFALQNPTILITTYLKL